VNNAQNLKWMSMSSLITAIIQFFQGLILANTIGVEAYGLVAVVLLGVGFAFTVVDFGYSNYLVKKRIPFFNVLLFFALSSSAVAFVNILILPSLIGFNEDLYILQIILFLYIFLFGLSQSYFIFFQKNGLFKIISFVEIISISLSFSFFIYKIELEEMSLFNYFVSFAILAFSRVLFFIIFSFKCYNIFYIKKIRYLFLYLEKGFRFASYQVSERFLNYLITRIEHIIILSILGSTFFALYIFAWNFVIQPITKVIPIFTKMLYPKLCNIKSQIIFQQTVINNLRSIKLIAYPILFGISLISKQFIVIFFDESWNNSIVILKILSILYILKVTFDVLNAILLAKNLSKYSTFWVLTQVVINSSSMYFYLVIYKGSNILFPIAISIVILKAIELYIYTRYLKFNLQDVLVDDVKILIALFFMFISSFMFLDVVTVLNLTLIVSVSLVVYFVSLLLLYQSNPFKLLKI
jgi:lipopolysaccharide exporter